jgi:hypothetical protein
MKPGLAIAGTILQRHHRGLVALAIYVAALFLFVVLSPQKLIEGASPVSFAVRTCMYIGVCVLPFAALYLIGIFTNPDSDVASPRSTYPTHFFTLPVKSLTLAFWPMLIGCCILSLLTLIVSTGLALGGLEFAPVEPALTISSILAMFQAAYWFPLGIPYSKLVLTIGICCIAMFVYSARNTFGWSQGARETVDAGLIVASFFVAWYGIHRARTGESRYARTAFPQNAPVHTVKQPKSRRSFRGGAEAQRWYEWRLQGITLPIAVAVLSVIFLIPLFFEGTTTNIPLFDSMGALSLQGNSYIVVFYPLYIGAVPFLAWCIGSGAKRNDLARDADRGFHLFFATRPLTDRQLYLQKLWTAARSTAWAWGIVLLTTLSLLFTQGRTFDGQAMVLQPTQPLGSLVWGFFDRPATLELVGLLGVLIFLTFRNQVVPLWAELSGKLWLQYSVGFFSIFLFLAAFASSFYWRVIDLYSADVIWFALAAKLVAFLWTGGSQIAKRAVDSRFVVALFACYAAAVPILYWFLRCWFGNEPASHDRFGVLIYQALPLLVLFYVPLTRVLLAPYMLGLNRHRR